MTEIQELERNLLRTMVALICRDPNGLLRIETAIQTVREIGTELVEGD